VSSFCARDCTVNVNSLCELQNKEQGLNITHYLENVVCCTNTPVSNAKIITLFSLSLNQKVPGVNLG
jgi:hypothetical protein